MITNEIENSKKHIIVEITEYVPNSVIIKTIIKKTTENFTAVSFNDGDASIEKINPFDTRIEISVGKAEIVINGMSNLLFTGQSIIVPAHTPNLVRASEHFKMISTIVKSEMNPLAL